MLFVAAGGTLSVSDGSAKRGPAAPSVPLAGYADVNGNKIDDYLETFGSQRSLALEDPASLADSVEVVVWLNHPVTESDVRAFEDAGGQLSHVYSHALDGFAGSLPRSSVSSFASAIDGGFNVIEASRPFNASLQVVTRNVRVRPYVWNASGLLGYRGSSNTSLAIIDTGIDASHIDLGTYINVSASGWGSVTNETKIVGWKDVQDGSLSPFDPHGHGSHCSGIATGRGAGSSTLNTTVTQSYTSYLQDDQTCRVRWFDIDGAAGLVTLRMNTTYYITPGGNVSLHVTNGNGGLLASNYSYNITDWNLTATYYSALANGTYGAYACNEHGADEYDFVMSYTYPAANESDGWNRLSGVAPEQKLVGVRVLNANGSASSAEVIAGFDWVAANKDTYRIRVASASLGSAYVDSAIDAAANNITASGVVFVVAAGNAYPTSSGVGSPASAAKVITVAAIDDLDNLTYYSSNALGAQGKPDISAPGGSVRTVGTTYNNTGVVLSADTNYDDNNGYVSFPDFTANDYVGMQGTSMAAPAVAGVAALVVQALEANGEPWAYAESQALKVKMLLLMTATETNRNREIYAGGSGNPSLDRGGRDAQEGFGRVNGDAAVEAAALSYSPGSLSSDSFGSAPSDRKAWARKVSLQGGRQYVFSLSVPAGADYDLYVYNSSPNSTGDPVIIAKSVNSSVGQDESVSYSPETNGTYYIVAKRVSGSGEWTFSSSGSGWVYGVVIDTSGNPVTDALVAVTNATGAPSNTTNSSGAFIIYQVPTGTYSLHGSANSSFRNATAGVTISTDLGTEANLSLLRLGIDSCGRALTEPAEYFVESPLSGSGNCITFSAGAGNSTLDCRGLTLTGSGVGTTGIAAASVPNISIRNCSVTNFSDGILLFNTSGSSVSACNCHDNGNDGIRLWDANNSIVSSSRMAFNHNVGLSLSSSSGCVISGNNASSNLYSGISLSDSANNSLVNNTADNNTYAGFDIASSSNMNNLSASNASLNGYYGVSFAASNANRAQANRFTDNVYYGVYLSDANLTSVVGNNLSDNQQNGVYAASSNDCEYASNAANGNGMIGMYFQSCARLNITGNAVNANAYYGIRGQTLTDSNLSGNTANTNRNFDGMNFNSSSNDNSFSNNTARFNARYGIYISSGSGTAMAANNACNNNHSTYDARCSAVASDGGGNACRAEDSCDLTCAACPLGYVEGFVSAANGSAVSGALVNLTNASGSPFNTTNASGYYRIDSLATGTYAVNASKTPEYIDRSSSVDVLIGSGTQLNISLADAPGWAFGTVFDEDGNPVENATVNFTNASGSPSNSTNATGFYTIYGMTWGTYGVSVAKNATYRTSNASVVILGGAGTDANLTLLFAPGRLHGFVTDSGIALPNATVAVSNASGAPWNTSDSNGEFTVYGVPRGTYLINVTHPGYYPMAENASFVPAEATEQNYSLTLEPTPIPTPTPTPTPYIPPSGGGGGGGGSGGDVGPTPTPRPTPVGGGTPLPPGCSPLGGACASSGDCCDSGASCVNYACFLGTTPTPTPTRPVFANLSVPGSVRVNDTVNLTIKDAATGNPLANATVQVTSPTGEVFTVTTDSSGHASFNASEEGVYGYAVQGYRQAAAGSTNAQTGATGTKTSPTPARSPTPLVTATPTPVPSGTPPAPSVLPLLGGVFILVALLLGAAILAFALRGRAPKSEAAKKEGGKGEAVAAPPDPGIKPEKPLKRKA